MSRPRAHPTLLIACACLLLAPGALAQQADRAQIADAVDRGVAFLTAQANDNGSVARDHRRHSTAMTSLSIMALTAVGHQPTDPTPQGKLLRDALDFILDDERQTNEGYFGRHDHSRMYGHGITTLMLCEMLGMGVNEAQDREIRDRAERAIDLILKAQAVRKHNDRYNGGWRYEPSSRDADLSITVWQLMALRAGKSAGIDVPTKAIDDAVAYLERSFRETGRGVGGFGYEPGSGPQYATTAAGLLAMQVCGRYDHEQVAAAAGFLTERPPRHNERWFFYGTYYFAIGMDQAGKDDEARKQAAFLSWKELSKRQRNDGAWYGSSSENDPVYATSLAILALSVQYHYLPIYQR